MILSRILEHKKAELRHKQSRGYLSELKTRIQDAPGPLGFAVTLEATRTAGSPSLIAEVKKASPSLGLLRPEFSERFDYLEIAKAYHAHGASALSVLTDKDFFQGSLDYLREIKQSVPLPALNKEFMVEEIQFYEARAYGADAVLLIVAALERQQLIDFYALARGLGLDVLIETHHERELDTVLERLPEARLIGINNRDLRPSRPILASRCVWRNGSRQRSSSSAKAASTSVPTWCGWSKQASMPCSSGNHSFGPMTSGIRSVS